jgi:hypothetical protein
VTRSGWKKDPFVSHAIAAAFSTLLSSCVLIVSSIVLLLSLITILCDEANLYS